MKRILSDELEGTFVKVKVYPRLIHVLKTITRANLGAMPTRGRQLERKLGVLQQLLERLEMVRDSLHGYRIEVTFRGNWDALRDQASFICSPAGLERYVGR